MITHCKLAKYCNLIYHSAGRKELLSLFQNKFYPQLYWLAFIYHRLFFGRVQFIVVVGSLGKTTTTNSIKYLLGLKVKNSFESNAFGAIATKILKTNPFTKYRILEVGIGRKGDMEKYARLIQPDYVILTSIKAEHIKNFGTIEEIWKEKAKIFSSKKEPQLVIYNGDDENIAKMLDSTNAEKLSYGFKENNDFTGKNLKTNFPNGIKFNIRHNKNEKEIKIALFGEKMAYCFLAAYTLVKKLNISDNLIENRTKKIAPSYGRMMVQKLKSGAFLVRDDFKSSEESVLAAYQFIKSYGNRKKIIIQGTLSHIIVKQRQLYKRVGTEAGKIADYVFFISSSDHEQAMTANAKKAGMDENNVYKSKGEWRWIADTVTNIAQNNDVILIKGSREQKLERLSLALQGIDVKCTIKDCKLKYSYCKDCSNLTK